VTLYRKKTFELRIDQKIESNVAPNVAPKQNGRIVCARKFLILKVGTAGFEPTASCTPSKRATRLRHVPNDSTESSYEADQLVTSRFSVVNKSSAIKRKR
jgi:hypothetical protein